MATIREIDGRTVVARGDCAKFKPRSPGTRGGVLTLEGSQEDGFWYLATALPNSTVAGFVYTAFMYDKPGVRAPCAALFGKAAHATFGASGDTIVFAVPSGGRETPDPLGRPLALATAVASAIDGVVHPLLSRRRGVTKLPSSGGRPARVAHLRDASFVSDAALKIIEQAFAAGYRRILGVDDDSWTKATRDEAVGALRAAIESLGLSGSMVVEFAVLFRKVGDAYPGDLRNELDAATHDEPGPASTARGAHALRRELESCNRSDRSRRSRLDHHSRCHRFSRICAVAREDEERCEKNGHVVAIYRTGGFDRGILKLYLGSHAVPKEKWSGKLKARVLALLAEGNAEAILQRVELVAERKGQHRDDVAAGRHPSIQDFYNENGGAAAVELELVMLIFARADETRTELKIAGLDYEQVGIDDLGERQEAGELVRMNASSKATGCPFDGMKVVDEETGETVPVNQTQKAKRKKKATCEAWTPQERAVISQKLSFGHLLSNAKKCGDAAGEAELKRQEDRRAEQVATAARLNITVADLLWFRRDPAAAAASLGVDVVAGLRDDDEVVAAPAAAARAAAEEQARAAAEERARAAVEAEEKARAALRDAAASVATDRDAAAAAAVARRRFEEGCRGLKPLKGFDDQFSTGFLSYGFFARREGGDFDYYPNAKAFKDAFKDDFHWRPSETPRYVAWQLRGKPSPLDAFKVYASLWPADPPASAVAAAVKNLMSAKRAARAVASKAKTSKKKTKASPPPPAALGRASAADGGEVLLRAEGGAGAALDLDDASSPPAPPDAPMADAPPAEPLGQAFEAFTAAPSTGCAPPSPGGGAPSASPVAAPSPRGLANITNVATVDAQMVDASPLKLSLVSVGRRDRGMEHALGAINILGRSSESDASDPKKLPLGVDLGETNISRKQCTLKRRGDGAYVATTFGSNSTGVVPGGKRRRALVAPGASRALELGDVVVLDIFEEHQSDVTRYSFAYQLRPRGGVMDDG